ncbi:hypothetical protein DFJ58DRAFT_841791 [Suillus subalutaceus]|uniref:uncharacterized protein n=1 Tax=Suillus subalutaceus TaxID=48586 RepID=UPI001B87D57C|nr:uncharacterized protein DFJ58DRAFT_841791 [Suillus subalutaceus]KAG1852754.1 hypothetical protein DFJ58DRAFT_841791 [Suillus subalutaceus]
MNLDTTSSSKALLGSGWSPPPSITSSPCIQLEAQKSAKSSNICLPDKVSDQHLLDNLKAVLKARLDLEDNQDGLSLGHCAIILEALQNPRPNTFVITNVTPAEYAVVFAFISEESDFSIRAKFNYFQDMQELQIMTPLSIHEQPTTHLFKAVTKYTDGIPYNKQLIDVTLHLNHRMQNKDFTNIPDLWQQSKDDSIASQILCASPTLDYEDFIPHRIKKSLKFGPVTIHSHIWIDVAQVRYTMFKHSADGHFDFSSKNTETFAEETIYPEIKMDNVERMLSEAAGSLKEYIISLLEGMGSEEPAIRSARESRPVWDPMWEAAVNQISTAVYLTAYCRYVDWHHHIYDKCKSSHQEVTQATSTSLLLSDPTAGSSSNLTTSSSTDQPHTPSTGLLIDIELARLAKKAKVDNRKVPEAKTKKSKSKKAKGQAKNL